MGRTNRRSIFILMLIVLLSFWGCAAAPEKKQDIEDEKTSQTSIEEKWGIRVVSIRPTAAGYMLNFSFIITDPEKAGPLVSRQVKPYVIDMETGLKVAVPNLPKVGSLRQRSGQPKREIVSFIVFNNPGQFIKSGSRVAVVIGDLSIEDLIVE